MTTDFSYTLAKPNPLQKGDKVAIVSLSFGVLGEPFCEHSLKIGIQNLKNLGLIPVFMPNALKGIEFIKNNPKARAEDLKLTFYDDSIKAIVCAIGGNDGYLLAPYLLGDEDFACHIRKYPKIFMGFSDSTLHHLMLYQLGLATFYGQAFLTDLAEVGYSDVADLGSERLTADMLPFSKQAFEMLFGISAPFALPSSTVWYDERQTHDRTQVGVRRTEYSEMHGVETLHQYETAVRGELLGGCVQSLYNILSGDRFDEQKDICDKWQVFPTRSSWRGKILFLETSEADTSPQKLAQMLDTILATGIKELVNGVLIGKPQNNHYYDEYKAVYQEAFDGVPTLYNLNFGHAYPRLILPYGATVQMDTNAKVSVISDIFAKT